MGCCSKAPKPVSTEADASPTKKQSCCGRPGQSNGLIPYNMRKTQDCLCCMIFLVFWIGMLVIGGIGLKNGKPMRLLYGTDYNGDTCGVGSMEKKKYTVYPRVNEDFLLNAAKSSPLDYKFYGVCVSSCPHSLDVVCNYGSPIINANASLAYTNGNMRECLIHSSQPTGVVCSEVEDHCWIIPSDTSSVLFRCIPSYNVSNSASASCAYPSTVTSAADPACIIAVDSKSGTTTRPAKSNQLFDSMNTARQLWGRWFGDLYRAWWVILVSAAVVSLILGFVWLLLAKWCTGIFVWGTIWLLLFVLSILTGYLYYKANLVTITVPESISSQLNSFKSAASGAAATVSYVVPQSLSSTLDSQTAYEVMAYVMTAVTLIILAMIIALRKAIKTAVRVIKLGAESLQKLPSLVFFPFTTVVALTAFLLWWIFVAASLATAGELKAVDAASDVLAGIKQVQASAGVSSDTFSVMLNSSTLNSTFSQYEDMPIMSYLLVYHFFGLLWTTQFILGFAVMSTAGTVCAWYFSRGDSDANTKEGTFYKLEKFPLWASVCRVLRFSMGTVAFGALLIAILQFIRACLAYLQRQLKNANGGKESRLMKFAFCCIQCCMWCIQKCVEMISRNALIYSSIKGTSFCESGVKVFKIIVANAGTMAAINILGEMIMFLGKVLIASCCAWVAYAILDNAKEFQPGGANEITSTWLVITVVLFFAYAVATGFMLVFDVCVDSILICYVVDVEENGKALHMDAGKLRNIQEEAKAEAAKDYTPPEEARHQMAVEPKTVAIGPSKIV